MDPLKDDVIRDASQGSLLLDCMTLVALRRLIVKGLVGDEHSQASSWDEILVILNNIYSTVDDIAAHGNPLTSREIELIYIQCLYYHAIRNLLHSAYLSDISLSTNNNIVLNLVVDDIDASVADFDHVSHYLHQLEHMRDAIIAVQGLRAQSAEFESVLNSLKALYDAKGASKLGISSHRRCVL